MNNKELMAQAIYVRGFEDGCCIACETTGIQDNNFKDELSLKEWNVSSLCQVCQDDIFDVCDGIEDDEMFGDSDAAFF